MNRFKNLLAMFAFSLVILGVPSVASAQWGNNRNDDYGRNRGGYYQNDLRGVLRRLESRTNEFTRRIDRELDRSRYDGDRREDRINDIAGDFREAVDKLEDDYDYNEGRQRDNSYSQAQRVLSLGSRLETALRRARLSYNLQGEWNAIRQDLSVVANYYGNNRNRNNYPNNRRGNNRRGW